MTETTTKMVVKADGTRQPFDVEKIKKRVDRLLTGLSTDHMMIPTCIDKVVKYAHNGKFQK